MKILAIDTSTIACSAAVADENKLYGELFTDFKLKHSEKLLVLCDSLFANLRMEISDMDCFAVSCGPGSFTGLRIGLATAKGFAQALDKPIVCVSSVQSLAYNAFYYSGLICPMLDAQRDQLYAGVYTSDGNALKAHTPENVYEYSQMLDIIDKSGKNALLLGDGAKKFYSRFENEFKNNVSIAEENILMPKASNVARIALCKISEGKVDDSFTAMPNYIRTAQAKKTI
jgi:tRNA threonylcarbamoyladenosine biosynthesis protein TsaB